MIDFKNTAWQNVDEIVIRTLQEYEKKISELERKILFLNKVVIGMLFVYLLLTVLHRS